MTRHRSPRANAACWTLTARARSIYQHADRRPARLEALGEEIARNWQSEKSAVEILSEMRR